jgi:uncharacterized protein (DUF1697 family)
MKHRYIPKFRVSGYILLFALVSCMTRYVAFLRGINVGGHIVVKATLEKVFNDLGFINVSTYKQSGNVIFESSEAVDVLATKIEAALKAAVGFEVPVFLRTLTDLKELVASDPFRGQNPEGTSFLVTFLSARPTAFPFQFPATIPKSTAQVIGAYGAEVFSVTHGGGEGALPNPFIEKTLKCKATTRNIHIIQEIVLKFS